MIRFAALSPISKLPHEVLLEIFKFYLTDSLHYRWDLWLTLAQVCQRWRHVVVTSPRYLDLQIITTKRKSASALISGWPALPIVIEHIWSRSTKDVDHIIAALEHNNRVARISLSDVPSYQLELFVAAMKKPFLELTSLDIRVPIPYRRHHPQPPAFPDSFLSGSCPSLQSLCLDGIRFPGLPKLLSSSYGLVNVDLWNIPYSDNIPPEEMATCLSPLKHLKSLKIRSGKLYYHSHAAGKHSPSLARVVLPGPALTLLKIHHTSKFLEGFVSRLNAPSLEEMGIMFPCYGEAVSNISELPQFISRIESFGTFDKADVRNHYSEAIEFIFSKQASKIAGAEPSSTFTPLANSLNVVSIDNLSQSTQVVSTFLPPLSRIKCLTLHIGATSMQEILHLFTAVTNMFISKIMATSVSLSMEGAFEGRATVMLPALRNIYVAELQKQGKRTRRAIQEFIAAKGLAGHHVNLHHWEPEVDGRS